MSTKTPKTQPRKCPVSHHTTDQEDFEPRDFTTNGRPSNLDCPFAKFAAQDLPDTPESHDPIAAEFHQDQASVNASTSASGPLGRCPIRFMDKHSPEEVTAYFENHKHELPRSHQVCVQRYQRDAAGAKQLDARYGSLTNMIQGLGKTHKPYLPGDERPVKQEASSSSAVEKWTESITKPEQDVPKLDHDIPEPERQSHFERPLREIRVGESPSRPWGISVPVTKDIPASVGSSEVDQRHARPTNGTTPVINGNGNAPNTGARAANIQPPETKNESNASQSGPTHIHFHGPVFIGYSPADAANFLKLLGRQDAAPEPT